MTDSKLRKDVPIHEQQVPLAVLCRIGSAIIHAKELLGPGGHEFDMAAFLDNYNDPDVQEWLRRMSMAGLLPVTRSKS